MASLETEVVNDRLHKYGFGSLRLLFFLLFLVTPQRTLFNFLPLIDSCPFELSSNLAYACFGIGGALLNLHVMSRRSELLILAILIATFLSQLIMPGGGSQSTGTVLVLYLLKTVGGDALAGKLDRGVWFRSLSIVFLLWSALGYCSLLVPSVSESLGLNSGVFLCHVLAHWLVEICDNHFVAYVLFRHRYLYEVTCALLLANSNLINRKLVLVDMIASLAYRVTNFVTTVHYYFEKKLVKS